MSRFKKRNLNQQIVDELGLRIVRGQVKPGETFPNEVELSNELGISRTVTREAIKVLTEKGMVISRPKLGTQVRPREQWSMLDADILHWEYIAGQRDILLQQLTEVRLILEPAAAELAALRANADDYSAMEAAYQAMATAIGTRAAFEDYIEADLQFHAAIVHGAHNELLLQVINVIRVALVDSRIVSASAAGRERDAYSENLPQHRVILEAIRDRKAEQAFLAMRSLIQTSRPQADLPDLLSQRPQGSHDAGDDPALTSDGI